MSKKKVEVVKSTTEPNKNDIWFNGKEFKYFGKKGWENIIKTSDIPAGDGTSSASGSSARELYVDLTEQGLTDEQKAYNAETFTLLQTQGFSMFIAKEGIVLYPINSADTYQPGDESIKLQYVQYDTSLTALLIYDLSLTQDGIVTLSVPPLAYKLTPYTEDEAEDELEVNIVMRELKSTFNDDNKNYNAVTYEKTIAGLSGAGPLPMLLYHGQYGSVGTLLTIYTGASYNPSEGDGWDFADKTKQFIGFVSPILGPVNYNNTQLLGQIRVALYEDGSYDDTTHIINAPAQ